MSDSLLGSDTRRRERPGIPGGLSLAGARPRAARRRSSTSHPAIAMSSATDSLAQSRAAVTAATSSRRRAATPSQHARTREFGREIAGDDERGRTGAEDMRLAKRVDGERTTQSHQVCWSGAARHTDLHVAVAVSAPRTASAPRATTPAPHPAERAA
jgi:hypothetical protein